MTAGDVPSSTRVERSHRVPEGRPRTRAPSTPRSPRRDRDRVRPTPPRPPSRRRPRRDVGSARRDRFRRRGQESRLGAGFGRRDRFGCCGQDLRLGVGFGRRRHFRRCKEDFRLHVGFARCDRDGQDLGRRVCLAVGFARRGHSAVVNRTSASTLGLLGGRLGLVFETPESRTSARAGMGPRCRATGPSDDYYRGLARSRPKVPHVGPIFGHVSCPSPSPHDRGSPTADLRPRSGGTPIPGVPPSRYDSDPQRCVKGKNGLQVRLHSGLPPLWVRNQSQTMLSDVQHAAPFIPRC